MYDLENMYLTKYQIVLILGILANFRACPAKVAKDSEWVTKPQDITETPDKGLEAEQEDFHAKCI